jgi:hypothetical protein
MMDLRDWQKIFRADRIQLTGLRPLLFGTWGQTLLVFIMCRNCLLFCLA